jgi:FKBP-type peptidyl-prolyl cis-trans isomerase FklB
MRMKISAAVVAIVASAALVAHADTDGAPATDKQKQSYGIGIDVGRNFRNLELDADQDWVIRGLKDGMAGTKSAIPEDDLRKIMTEFQQQIMQKQRDKVAKMAADNKKAGDDFRADYGKKDGVKTLDNGLQYRVIAAGDGKMPTDADTVKCNYRGTFIDGREFDKSPPGQPATFPLNGVIPGWQEILKLMPVGSKWEVVIPPELAYGDRGAGRQIAPNTTLVFEIELVGIQ